MDEYSVTDEQLEAEAVIDTPRAVLEWPCLRKAVTWFEKRYPT
ncbi:hypothetical protein HMPREF0972_02213 [Actinomyces sp. oral taxon 848 str. F0332]|nr:hypothetical protein [Peptidiphaga gingivicola]EEZ77135.1 hypothetical protein HMPREF0972_02213 [Actinomyces sp. oral taxon 848 str. F0332]